MKAIKIDVVKKDVYYVDILKGGQELRDIYKHLECDTFCVGLGSLPQNDLVYVDDNGLLLSYNQVKGVFSIKGQPQPLVGHGLVVGVSKNGASRDVKATVDDVKKIVEFLPKVVLLAIAFRR